MANGAIDRLRDIEEAIALADRQRLLITRTTDLAVGTVLRESWPDIVEAGAITEMVVRRMFYHYKAQKELKSQIGLSIIPSASGVFQQVVGTYLRAYLQKEGSYDVHLDRLYDGELRPDIAVESGADRLAVIEVKTDLGWHRHYIRAGGWAARRKQCCRAGFRAAYLLILSNLNWPGFEPEMEGQGVRVLLSGHPNGAGFKWYANERAPLERGRAGQPVTSGDVIHPIEALFEEVAQLAEVTSAAGQLEGV